MLGYRAAEGMGEVGELVGAFDEVPGSSVPTEAAFDEHVLVPTQAQEVSILGRFAEPALLEVAGSPAVALGRGGAGGASGRRWLAAQGGYASPRAVEAPDNLRLSREWGWADVSVRAATESITQVAAEGG